MHIVEQARGLGGSCIASGICTRQRGGFTWEGGIEGGRDEGKERDVGKETKGRRERRREGGETKGRREG